MEGLFGHVTVKPQTHWGSLVEQYARYSSTQKLCVVLLAYGGGRNLPGAYEMVPESMNGSGNPELRSLVEAGEADR